jgi:alpha-D-ribose 1-methylphosphonate 5-triphosphate synthase subunit PhnL
MDETPERLHLQVRGLSKRFTLHTLHEKQVVAFEGVDLDVPVASFTGLAGASGSGKSSLLKVLYRTYLASEGQAYYTTAVGDLVDLVHATERTILKLRRYEIGYVSQFLRVEPRVPALDVVAGARVAQGTGLSLAREEAAELFARLGLPRDLWDSYPVLFSGGEQQRVNIARALITRPRFLLLDEPTSALDRQNVGVVLDLLEEARERGTTMLGIFHDPEIVVRLCDRVCLIQGGRLLGVLPPSEANLDAVFSVAVL